MYISMLSLYVSTYNINPTYSVCVIVDIYYYLCIILNILSLSISII